MESIKSCPFCGSNAITAGDFWCRCETCGAEVSQQRTRHNPALSERVNNVLAWNRRASGLYKDSCPFCGGDNLGLSVCEADDGRFWVYCADCFAQGPDGSTETEAEKLWGR